MAKISKSKDREHRKRETEMERSKQYMWLLDLIILSSITRGSKEEEELKLYLFFSGFHIISQHSVVFLRVGWAGKEKLKFFFFIFV